MIGYGLPETFYPVSIMDVDPKDRSIEKVVNSGGDYLRPGSALSPSRNKVHARHALNKSGYVRFRVGFEVSGKNQNQVSPSIFYPRSQRCTHPEISDVSDEPHFNGRVVRLLENLGSRSISATI